MEDGTILVVFVDLTLIGEDWYYRGGDIGLRTINEVYLFLFFKVLFVYNKTLILRVQLQGCNDCYTHGTATQMKIQNISVAQKVALFPAPTHPQ